MVHSRRRLVVYAHLVAANELAVLMRPCDQPGPAFPLASETPARVPVAALKPVFAKELRDMTMTVVAAAVRAFIILKHADGAADPAQHEGGKGQDNIQLI